jgi:phage tail sheath gpL-like
VAVKAVREQVMEQMELLTQEEVVEVREDFRRHRLVARAGRAL